MANELLLKQLDRDIQNAKTELSTSIRFLISRLEQAEKKSEMGYAPGTAGIVQDMGSKIDSAAARLESLLKLKDFWRGL